MGAGRQRQPGFPLSQLLPVRPRSVFTRIRRSRAQAPLPRVPVTALPPGPPALPVKLPQPPSAGPELTRHVRAPRAANQPARPAGGNERARTRASASARRNPAGSQWLPRAARAARAHAHRCLEPRTGSRGRPRPVRPRPRAGRRACAVMLAPLTCGGSVRAVGVADSVSAAVSGSSAPLARQPLARGRLRSFFTHRPRCSLLQFCFGRANNRSFVISKKRKSLMLNRLLQLRCWFGLG